jgi:hypothetical protein
MSPLQIFIDITIPIFILVGIGYGLDRAFRLDVQTMVRISFYVFIPATMLLSVLRSEMRTDDILAISGFFVAHFVAMMALSLAVFSLRPFRSRRSVLTFGSVFYNAGNYGFPLAVLAFGEWSVGVMAVVLLEQVILLFSVGVLLLLDGHVSLKESLVELLRMPSLYAIAIGIVLRALGIELIDQVAIPLDRLGDGFVSVVLMTLGVQLSRSRLTGEVIPVLATVGMRLVVSPVLAAVLVSLLSVPAHLTPVLMLAGGLPVAVNVSILANQYGREADLTSQMVFWTTLLSAVTIPILLSIIPR